MSDGNGGTGQDRPARGPWAGEAVAQQLSEAECLSLIAGQEVGRIAYSGRFGLTVLPVNYRLHDGAVVFRTRQDSPMGEDLRTGIAHAEYQVAFEADEFDREAREGWSVLVQGSAHHVESGPEREWAAGAGVDPWPPGEKELFIKVTPIRVTGRRIRQAG
jgi:Pyridoxamine 5'-phosphate oxidase